MNEHFKLSKTSRNDLESICIVRVIRSVPAKFGLPRHLDFWTDLHGVKSAALRFQSNGMFT